MKVSDALARVDAASDELLAVHDAIKHGSGVQATFPWPHDWNADAVVDRLNEAHRAASEAGRLLAKVTGPEARGEDG